MSQLREFLVFSIVSTFLLSVHSAQAQEAPYAKLTAVPFNDVTINDTFWTPRINTIQRVTLPDILNLAEQEDGWIKNFRIVAGLEEGVFEFKLCSDSDVYKLLEGTAYTLAWRPDSVLEKRIDGIIAAIAAAQAEDGYLNTTYMLPSDHPASPDPTLPFIEEFGYGREKRWQGTVADWPMGIGQLYCAGHLMEAAAAHHRATGKRNLLEVAIKLANNIYTAFPINQPIKYPDHPQIGIGLIKLYQVTGDKRYLELAKHLVLNGLPSRPVDIGDGESHKPLLEQRKAYGHAVRTGYTYSALADLCGYYDDQRMREATNRLWHSIVDCRMFIHGGVGNGTLHEQHGEDYDLPNAQCYCECCANIAQAQWNHRLNTLSGDARYADIVELVAYNGGLSGISLEGTKYFYTNPLAAGLSGRTGQTSGVRKRYLFCCPSKLPGFVAGVSRWIYAKDASSVYVNLYVGGSGRIELKDNIVTVRQDTRYPWNGLIKLTVEPVIATEFDLCLRIPGWTQDGRPLPSDLYRGAEMDYPAVSLKVNGEAMKLPALDKGYMRIRRHWQKGDTVELNLPMPVRRVCAHHNVKADAGRVALMRGPVLYCLEGVDNPEFSVLNMVLPKEKKTFNVKHDNDLLGGVTVLRGEGMVDGETPVHFVAIPYYAWQNRGIHEMATWLIEDPSLCEN